MLCTKPRKGGCDSGSKDGKVHSVQGERKLILHVKLKKFDSKDVNGKRYVSSCDTVYRVLEATGKKGATSAGKEAPALAWNQQ